MRGLSALICSRLGLAAIIALSLGRSTVAATCDRACLLQQATQFNRNMLAHTTDKIPLARAAVIRENTKAISLGVSKCSTVKQIRSEGVFADPVLGNVIEHVTAETDAGKIVYIGTRLKVVDGKVTEVEINFDERPEVNAKNLIPYDPLFNTIVPEGERATREQLERIITSYFQGLTVSVRLREQLGERGRVVRDQLPANLAYANRSPIPRNRQSTGLKGYRH